MTDRAESFDVLVVGGGPAGLAAAVCAAESGQRVGLVDDNPLPGGQIWRAERGHASPAATRWMQRLQACGAELRCGVRIFHQPSPGILLGESHDLRFEFTYSKLVVATGAREIFFPFPGWTLPNVMGAGGLQSMVKSGLPIENKKVVVGGSGPLLLAVAAYLKTHGADVRLICEQASWSSLAKFAGKLLSQRHKITEALALRHQLSGVPYSPGSWVIRAEGEQKLQSVTVSRQGKLENFECDYLACGFHLTANTEVAALLGCRITNGLVEVDQTQETSVPGIFCVGEPSGIGGLDLAIIEGQIAGFATAGRSANLARLFKARGRLRKFAVAMDQAFAPRHELRALPQPETIICRCEDVRFAALKPHASWRAAKLQTRCGMGPCQGRICGPATQFLFNWRPDSVRPPFFPATFSSLAAPRETQTQNPQAISGGS